MKTAELDRLAGLYLHVPFCGRVCPYCDFAVRTGGDARRRRYVDHMALEIEHYADWSIPFDTVYVGGGTPSCLTPEQLGRLLEAVSVGLPVRDDAWITLEANPEDVTPAALRAWAQLGVRVLSLGVQSLDDDELRFLGRDHDRETALRALRLALRSEIPVVSVDLMFGFQGQSFENLRRSFDVVAGLWPPHVSCYQLTFHRGTPFHRLLRRGAIEEMPEATQADRYDQVHALLAGAGYEAYEVSNFARDPIYESRHNRKYWRHDPYLGLGPSAHSFNGVRSRWWNARNLNDWEAALGRAERPVAGSERLRSADLALEAVMLGLRTRDGIDCDQIAERHGTDLWESSRDQIESMASEGLVTIDGRRVRPTVRGLAVADHLTRRIHVPERTPSGS